MVGILGQEPPETIDGYPVFLTSLFLEIRKVNRLINIHFLLKCLHNCWNRNIIILVSSRTLAMLVSNCLIETDKQALLKDYYIPAYWQHGCNSMCFETRDEGGARAALLSHGVLI